MSGVGRVLIGAEVRGQYRVWRAETEGVSRRIEETVFSDPFGMATGDFTQRKGKGRERAAIRLRRLAEGAGARFVDREEGRLRWAYLRPADDRIVTALMTGEPRK